MNTRIVILILTAVMSLAAASRAADFDMAAFDQATQELKTYKFGENKVDLNQVERLVAVASRDDNARLQVEQKLLNILAEATTYDARQFVCRLLRTIGTAKSVGPLESLLTDPELSHMARYALGRIQSPEAGAALRRGLGRTRGNLQAGIINTLAQCHYVQAAPDMARLVDSSDREVRIAAIKALGRFGGEDSVAVLKQARPSAPEDIRMEIDDALLGCAEQYLAEGKNDQAAAIYQGYYSGDFAEPLRVAGLRGLAAARGPNAAALLVEAINGNDPALRRSAIAMLSLATGPKTTDLFVGLLATSPADGQELMIRALAERGDVTATPAVIRATGSEHEIVRLAAYETLGDIGNADAIACLARAAGTAGNQEQQIARASLVRMKGPNIDAAFLRAVNAGDPQSRQEVIRAIGQRNTPSAFPTLYQVAQAEPEDAVRQEAILSAGRVGTASDLQRLVDLAVAPKDPGDRPAIARAITTVFNKMEDKDEEARPVILALKRAPNEARPVLLGLLSQPATAEAFAAVRDALESTDSPIVDAAIRTLGDWPNADPAEELCEIASRSLNPTHRSLALRSYVRMATLAAEPTPIYVKAMGLARNDNEIKMVLGGLGNADTLEALEMAEKHMARKELEAEASLAAIKVASQYGWENAARARQTLERIIRETPHDPIRKQAQNALKMMAEYKEYIIAWLGSGPYKVENVNDGRTVFETVFPPEKDPNDPSLKWVRIKAMFEGDKRINLERTFGGVDYCSAYLRTAIWSPVDQAARIHWNADDYIKGWINGRPASGGTIQLRQGQNTFMLKVGDHGGGWNFNCKLTQPDGSPIPGLRFERK